MRDWLQLIPTIVTAVAGLAGLLGLAKYLIEPWYSARALRRKYATALWIACSDLHIHLDRIRKQMGVGDSRTSNASEDPPKRLARESRLVRERGVLHHHHGIQDRSSLGVASNLSARAALPAVCGEPELPVTALRTRRRAKSSISTNTCFWYDYLDAVGDRLVSQLGAVGSGGSLAPMSFAEFCQRYATDQHFLLFYDQAHRYIHLIGDGQRPYIESMEKVLESLKKVMGFLERQRFLPGFEVRRPEISGDEIARTVEPQPGPGAQPG